MRERLDDILAGLTGMGLRITRMRRALIGALLANGLPLSASELMGAMRRSKLAFNKTTVYRELGQLKGLGVIKEIQFLHERVKRYELAEGAHHHHLICLRCKRVEDIVLERELEEQERQILDSRGFKVLDHSLEFLGLCQACR